MKHFLLHACIAFGTLLSLASCYNDEYAADTDGTRATMVELSLTMPLSSVEAGEGYENGTIYENSINTYRIYFYDYDTNTFIARLNNVSMTSDDTDLNTKYTITGKLAGDGETNPLEGISDFKVVMLANWDTYAEPTEGSTIEGLCEGLNAQYAALASGDMDLSTSNKHLPYYGVHTYTGVVFPKNGTIRLGGTLTLLRAVAKVEVVIDNDEDDVTLASATLHRYNSKGYCAPSGVYSEDDYGQANDWASDYTGTNIHLVDNENDSGEKTLELIKVKDRERDASGNITQKETWMAYVPEYDNSGTDYSYINLEFDHQLADDNYNVYFAVYDEDGATHAYDTDVSEDEVAKRRDIHRNNLYRFNVTYSNTQGKLIVVSNEWEDTFDNEWTFGTMDGTGEILGDGVRFMADDVEYEVTNSENREVMVTYITGEEGVITTYWGDIIIPEVVRYDGVDYIVVAIGEESFYYGQGITSVTIPKTVSKIGMLAFYDCDNLVSITCYNPEPPACEDNVFQDADIDTCTLYCPSGSVETYKATEPWSSFTYIQEIQDEEP